MKIAYKTKVIKTIAADVSGKKKIRTKLWLALTYCVPTPTRH
jgi:hypothetical protein